MTFFFMFHDYLAGINVMFFIEKINFLIICSFIDSFNLGCMIPESPK